MEYWVPRFKYELVEALSKVYPRDRFKFKRMTKKQLYAIFYRVRKYQCGVSKY